MQLLFFCDFGGGLILALQPKYKNTTLPPEGGGGLPGGFHFFATLAPLASSRRVAKKFLAKI